MPIPTKCFNDSSCSQHHSTQLIFNRSSLRSNDSVRNGDRRRQHISLGELKGWPNCDHNTQHTCFRYHSSTKPFTLLCYLRTNIIFSNNAEGVPGPFCGRSHNSLYALMSHASRTLRTRNTEWIESQRQPGSNENERRLKTGGPFAGVYGNECTMPGSLTYILQLHIWPPPTHTHTAAMHFASRIYCVHNKWENKHLLRCALMEICCFLLIGNKHFLLPILKTKPVHIWIK